MLEKRRFLSLTMASLLSYLLSIRQLVPHNAFFTAALNIGVSRY
jgi:hypothetical protein